MFVKFTKRKTRFLPFMYGNSWYESMIFNLLYYRGYRILIEWMLLHMALKNIYIIRSSDIRISLCNLQHTLLKPTEEEAAYSMKKFIPTGTGISAFFPLSP